MQLLDKPTAIGYWVEYIANKPRHIVLIRTLDQEFPSGSKWFQIPTVAEP